MKKSFYYFAAAALVLCSACNKNEIAGVDEPVNKEENIIVEEGKFFCEIDQNVEVKTSLDASLNVVWDETDAIAIIDGESHATYEFESYASADNKKSAVFVNSVSGQVVASPACAVYPASALESCVDNEVKLSLGSIKTVTMPAGKESVEILSGKDISGLPMFGKVSADKLVFTNLCGGIRFSPYDYAGLGILVQKIKVESNGGEAIGGTAVVNPATGDVVFEGTDKSITMTCANTNISTNNALPADGSTFTSAAQNFVVFLPAGTYASGLTITLIDNMGRCFAVSTGAITIKNGIVQKMTPLPLTISYGQTNCIRVAPGTTSVDVDITPYYSYNPTYQVNGRHPIKVENGNLSHYGQTPKILWQQTTTESHVGTDASADAVISGTPTVKFDDKNAKATMTVALTGEVGNALVAICFNNTIAWSFHIWVGEANEQTCGSYTFLDRNLGAVSTAHDKTSYGLNYQWGRKDPLPRNLATGSSASYVECDIFTPADRNTVKANIAYTIQNPTSRIALNGTNCKWFYSGRNKALWGNANDYGDSGSAKNATTVKTVYDPCPAGYKVSTYGALVSLAGQTKTVETGKGYTLGGIFIPYAGISSSAKTSTASLIYPGYRGYLWSSISRSDTQGAYILWYNGDGINQNKNSTFANIYTYLGDAMPVRCIKE